MKSIGRIFEFINYNIPPTAESDFSAGSGNAAIYTTIGFFDALRTELLPNASLSEMRIKNEEYVLNQKGSYSFQNTLAVRQGDEEEEKKFWESDEKLPLTFITFIQLHGYEVEKDASSGMLQILPGYSTTPCSLQLLDQVVTASVQATKKRKYPKSVPSSSDLSDASDRPNDFTRVEIEHLCYQTFDKNDFVICFKTNHYKAISDLLLQLHTKMELVSHPILYSYSIFSVHRDFINGIKKGWKASLEQQAETIASISFQGISNTRQQSMRKWYRYYCRQLALALFPEEKERAKGVNSSNDCRLYDTIGDHDFRLIARNVKLTNLLEAMCKEGPLNYGSEVFKEALFSSLLVLNVDSEEDVLSDGNDDIPESRFRPPTSYRCDELREEIETLSADWEAKTAASEGIASLSDGTYETLYVSLRKLLNSLAALERSPARKYDFETLYWPLRRLKELLYYAEADEDGNRHADLSGWESYNNLPRLIQCMSTTLHSTLRTDIQFFQVNDFNVVIHYAPAKLRAFYNIWINKLVGYYQGFSSNSGSPNAYEFVISTSNYPMIRAKELIRENHPLPKVGNKAYRLMYIYIPERLLYEPQYTCSILAHEIAHFGGGPAKRRIPSECNGKMEAINRRDTYISCVSTWFAYSFHSNIMTVIHDQAMAGSVTARLLQLLFQLYMSEDHFNSVKPITETITYQDLHHYLSRSLLKDRDNPEDSAITNAKTSRITVLLTKGFLSSYLDPITERTFYINFTTTIQKLGNDFEAFLNTYWDDPEILPFIQELIPDCPPLSRRLMMEVSFLFRKCLADGAHNTETTTNLQIEPSEIRLNTLSTLMDVIREAQVDLFAILSMELSPEEYLNLFTRTNQLTSMDGQPVTALPIPPAVRILLIILTMKRLAKGSDSDHLTSWSELEWDNPDADHGEYSVIFHALQDFTDYIDEEAFCIISHENPNNGWADGQKLLLLRHWNTLTEILKYLTACGHSILSEEYDKKEQEKIVKTKKALFSQDIYTQVQKIDECLLNYEFDSISMYNQYLS